MLSDKNHPGEQFLQKERQAVREMESSGAILFRKKLCIVTAIG